MVIIRRGSDIVVKWAFHYSDGTAFPIADYTYDLIYYTGRGRTKVEDTTAVSASGNLLTWTFPAAQQLMTGAYGLALRVTLNGVRVATFDKKDVFCLGNCGEQAESPFEVNIKSLCDYIPYSSNIQLINQASASAAAAVEAVEEIEERLGLLTIEVGGGGLIPSTGPFVKQFNWVVKEAGAVLERSEYSLSYKVNDGASVAVPADSTFVEIAFSDNSTVKFTAIKGAKSASAETSVLVGKKSYYGSVPADFNPTGASVAQLPYLDLAERLFVSAFTLDAQKICFAYPVSMGDLVSIKDMAYGIQYINSFNKSTVSISGVTYNVYTLADQTSVSELTLEFK